jgi:hypothetical protein
MNAKRGGVTITVQGRDLVIVCGGCKLEFRTRVRDDVPAKCPRCKAAW